MKKLIAISQHQIEADFILRNAMVADVFLLQWKKADLVVANGRIIAVDSEGNYKAKHEENANGRYCIPGLIDAHIHIESSMLTPEHFSRILLPHGVTTAITDPHEIANVAGTKGLSYMIDEARHALMDIYYMLPSSVPATSFEHAGAILKAADLAQFTKDEQVLGLAEVMDFAAVLNGDDDMLEKIQLGLDNDMIIDGHAAGLNAKQITGYRAANIHTDHECVNAEEAIERVTQGMFVLMREGSAAKNVRAILPAVSAQNARRFAFCTDDKHLDEIIEEGTINASIAIAIKEGMEPLQAIQIASLNAAECYRLHNVGALAAGFQADFVLLDDLETMQIAAVWKRGEKVAENGVMLSSAATLTEVPASILQSVQLPNITVEDFKLPLTQSLVNIIEIIPHQIITKKLTAHVDVVDGEFVPSIDKDYLKIAVFERHLQRGTKSVAIVHGLGLQAGAVATTISHDSHNAIVVGTNDEDMATALNALQEMQGGLIVVKDGKVLAQMALPIGGIMTNVDASIATKELHAVHEALHILHPTLSFHLFLTLSFLALPVIPSLKLTDTGLFDVEAFEHINIEVK
ncbi:adenine deaminase [Solibacillus sp. MA9]|uniref:Adenine deaminase n=1 Tax=Solibacillus palustris TaxID=2908203 RepID=A0ABS9UAX3_9BACL|nr:adenine deaminase [Solibacillus sp. MA9]MCH7321358.1 adenine deaminase [Solibacillus sp. MA9]